MRFPAAMAILCGGLAAAASVSASAGAASAQTQSYQAGAGSRASAAGRWGHAHEVPGTAALNVGGNAAILAISCPSPGNCAAGGHYGSDTADRGVTEAFVVSESGGRWGRARPLPGIAALHALSSDITTISCASRGNCAAGGRYVDFSGDSEAMIISERAGHWGHVIEVPGTAALNAGGDAAVNSVSCAAPGGCVAAGFYFTGTVNDAQAFVVSQRSGRWQLAQPVRGIARLNTGGHARANSVSCSSAGNCAVGGFYVDTAGRWQAFVNSERHGRWSRAIEVPGTAGLNIGGNASVDSVSCPSPGNCTAGGYYEATEYRLSTAKWQAFGVSQRGGRWGRAVPLLRIAAVHDNTIGAAAESVSCTSAGTCAVGGAYYDRRGHLHAFVASQRGGRWKKAIQVPGTPSLNRGGTAETLAVSCAAGGNCAAAGYYTRGGRRAFVATERNGRWGRAIPVPGLVRLDAGHSASLIAISCASPGPCSAGGYYTDRSGHGQAFVVRTR